MATKKIDSSSNEKVADVDDAQQDTGKKKKKEPNAAPHVPGPNRKSIPKKVVKKIAPKKAAAKKVVPKKAAAKKAAPKKTAPKKYGPARKAAPSK